MQYRDGCSVDVNSLLPASGGKIMENFAAWPQFCGGQAGQGLDLFLAWKPRESSVFHSYCTAHISLPYLTVTYQRTGTYLQFRYLILHSPAKI